MGDRFPAHIEIGGKLPVNLIPEFCKQVSDIGGLEWDGGYEKFTPDKLQDYHGGSPHYRLHLYDIEARNGQFEELEYWLRLNGLDYTRWSDARYEYNAEVCWYRQDAGVMVTRTTDTAGDVVERVAEIRPTAEHLLGLLENFQSLDKNAIQQHCLAVSAKLRQFIGDLPDDTPPLHIFPPEKPRRTRRIDLCQEN